MRRASEHNFAVHEAIEMRLCKIFSARVKKRSFPILHGNVLTHARWSDCEMIDSFRLNLAQKLSKSVKVAEIVAKKVYRHVLWLTVYINFSST